MARHVAKNVVAAKLADRCEVQIAYAIGVAKPVSVHVNTFGTARFDEGRIEDAISQVFDLRPKAIIRELDLLRPIYGKTATGGHFGPVGTRVHMGVSGQTGRTAQGNHLAIVPWPENVGCRDPRPFRFNQTFRALHRMKRIRDVRLVAR